MHGHETVRNVHVKFHHPCWHHPGEKDQGLIAIFRAYLVLLKCIIHRL